MVSELNIEAFDQLREYLRAAGVIAPNDYPVFTALAGGVSNRTVLVEPSAGPPFVMKQALARLRVATEWLSDPKRIEREALGMKWLARLAPTGAIPELLFEDRQHHLLAMQAVPQPHENWKTRLLGGEVELEIVRQFADLLASIHRGSWENRELAREFGDQSFFESLRLDPYYRFTAAQVPAGRGFLEGLIAETTSQRLSLVHGDYSPKNVLIHRGRLILLDHEVIHYGDPAFDLGFSLTHFLSKARHLPAWREAFFTGVGEFWRKYLEKAGDLAAERGFEGRCVRHTLACLLARVDGRSPLEYLTTEERDRQRAVVLALMGRPPETMTDLLAAFAAAPRFVEGGG